MGTAEEYDELILRHLDQETSEEETSQINEYLANDAEFQRRFCAIVMQVAQIRRLLAASCLVEPPAASDSSAVPTDDVERRIDLGSSPANDPTLLKRWMNRSKRLLLAVAVGASFAAVGVWVWSRQSVEALSAGVVEFHGEVHVRRGDTLEPVTRGRKVRPSETMLTGATGYVRLNYTDGSVVDLNGDTEVTVLSHERSKAIDLVRGTIFLDIAKQPEFAPFIINPGRRDQVVVVGTKLQLNRTADGETRVGVVSGKVKVGVREKAVVVESQSETVVKDGHAPLPAKSLVASTVWYGLNRGLIATYYDNPDFTGPSATRIDPNVDFNWQLGAPVEGIDGEDFSARWTGQIEPVNTDDYVFTIPVDDSARLWIDGVLVIDAWNTPPRSKHNSPPVRLEAGRRYDIRVDYRDLLHHAEVHLYWSSSTFRETLVPQLVLFPTRN